ncbi:MAG: polyprenyl synthetase family protein [Erysipelothrix sp.]|nr:polyprenyl synthetase family protein [Erysipelothrix sp.]
MIHQLSDALKSAVDQKPLVFESMAYSLLSDGKRIRPMMLLSLLSDLGGDYTKGIDAAVALEMVHTYSLVHDDLPAMDNDDYRRHRLTNHKVYGEGIAILAGDGLLTQAFMELSKVGSSDCIEVLARNAGPLGMILGQELDIKDEFDSLEDLTQCYLLKTGCLFAAALEMAALIADRKDLQESMRELGYKLGVVFQYQDDILEATQSFETLGKSSDSDTDRGKNTIVGFLGIDEAKKTSDALFDEIQTCVGDYPLLKAMIDSMFVRAF